tara:strand:+ start:69 stop:245 length:177 start_codon:yes stop_codon:yes gene_type:complete
MSLMKEPLGDGNVRVTKFEDYIKYKFGNPDTVWMEFEPLLIFPDCMRTIEDDDEEERI